MIRLLQRVRPCGRRLFVLWGLFVILWSTAPVQADVSTLPRSPKLIVIIIIDQFRFDYLTRFQDRFGPGGFRRLLEGANFTNCNYRYGHTVTGAGHATLLTGAYPASHGIIGNSWYDRQKRRTVGCVEDAEAPLVGVEAKGSGASPRKLLLPTLGDELRKATNGAAKVLAIALKDRGAILPGGHAPTGAYWYDATSGRFITSRYYAPTLPEWVEKFNASRPPSKYCGMTWSQLLVGDSETPRVFSQYQAAAGEPCPDERFLGWLGSTPYISEIEFDFARRAVLEEGLGRDGVTDLLTLSLLPPTTMSGTLSALTVLKWQT